MQCVGNRGDQFRGISEGRLCLCNPCRQVAAFDELRDDEAETIRRPSYVMDRHDVGMVQFGEYAGFSEKRFYILGVSDSFRVWHLDGYGAVEVIVVSKIDPSEPALTQASEDRVTPDLLVIAAREATRPLTGRFCA